jgi:hypothetical protein
MVFYRAVLGRLEYFVRPSVKQGWSIHSQETRPHHQPAC